MTETAILKRMDRMELELYSIKNMLSRYVSEEFDVKEAASYLRVSAKTIHNLYASRKIIGKKKGRARIFTRDELDNYLKSIEV